MPKWAQQDISAGGLQRHLWTGYQYGELLSQVQASRDALRKQLHSAKESLVVHKKKNVRYHDLLVAMADNNQPRVARLIYVALHSNPPKSSMAMFRLVTAAAAGAYKVASYTGAELDLMLLVHRLGGVSLTFAVAKAMGMPSLTTTLKHIADTSRKF